MIAFISVCLAVAPMTGDGLVGVDDLLLYQREYLVAFSILSAISFTPSVVVTSGRVAVMSFMSL